MGLIEGIRGKVNDLVINGAGGLCVHLAAMMCDMEERKTVFFSGRMQE